VKENAVAIPKQQPTTGIALRGTAVQDLEPVVALDAAHAGRARQGYFQRRLKAALAQPAQHVQFSAEQNGRFVGFIMARRLLGEFGRAEPALRLEAIGVAQGEQGKGIGTALLARLESEAKRLGVPVIRSTASWRDHSFMRFFDRAGFELSKVLVLESAMHKPRLAAHEGDKVLAPAHLTGFSASEVDYSAPAANDFEALARAKVDVRVLTAEDLKDIVRIDHGITGRRREAYIGELVEEAMTDSAVRVSLVARVDGIAAGFVMARTDFGDFGRAEPVAVLDTIGVDPDYGHRGVGHALLTQLFANLEGLRVERVESEIAREDFGLLGFLYDIGFDSAQRLSFVKQVG
jgi:GNAT superfamily N-acetyltransferase